MLSDMMEQKIENEYQLMKLLKEFADLSGEKVNPEQTSFLNRIKKMFQD